MQRLGREYVARRSDQCTVEAARALAGVADELEAMADDERVPIK
jgi:hypothetical protein